MNSFIEKILGLKKIDTQKYIIENQKAVIRNYWTKRLDDLYKEKLKSTEILRSIEEEILEAEEVVYCS